MICQTCNETYLSNSYCRKCYKKKKDEQYLAMPVVEWDGTTPISMFDDDGVFYTEDEFVDYCDEEGVAPSDLKLVLCKPVYAKEIDLREINENELPDDYREDRVFPKEIIAKVKEINDSLSRTIIAWKQGNTRITTPVEQDV